GDDEDVRESDNDHDERTKSDDEEEEKQDDEFVHTSDDNVPTEDETNDESKEFDEEEYEELYGDVNISLKDDNPDYKQKGDMEMTNTKTGDAKLENVNQKGVGNQVNDDAQETQKTEATPPYFSMAGEEISQPPQPIIASTEAPQVVSSMTLPILKKGEYILWNMKMEQYLAHTDYAPWKLSLM
nr:ribonuclease H-like domain-containing protein [Tanacetum cinerariifolium]